ncbi:hypothetical protein [Nocardia rhizosphaerae]|uniref:Uncharacterized protein n=1 Tax=Nocardia rhizosphaerae TaxID=1691571 RepID=A0ABV8KYG9_9NOCA
MTAPIDPAPARAALDVALSEHELVNVCGPLGVGKTVLVEQLADAVFHDAGAPGPTAAGPGPLVIDGADGAERLATARAIMDRHDGPVVVVTRQPLACAVEWTARPMATVALDPLPDARIDGVARAAGIDDPAARAWVTALACGIPLIATAAARALHAGIEPSATGAIADRIALELTDRIGRELPGRRWQYALRGLATAGAADEGGLAAGPELFSMLSGLSVITPGTVGLAIDQPYREILDLAYRWRQPTDHRSVRDRAATRARTLLRGATSDAERAALTEQAVFASASAPVRATLFPAARGTVPIRRATTADADEIAELMRKWARRNDFDPRRAERVVAGWIDTDIAGFHLAHDPDGTLAGLVGLLPIAEHTAACIDPVLQQHSAEILDTQRGGLFLGAAFGTNRAAHAQILRHTLRAGAIAGKLVVSTANPEYLNLLRSLRFDPHGGLRDDVYRCGRAPEVYSNDFAAGGGRWLARLSGAATEPDPERIAHALNGIHDTTALAVSPLLASPATPTAAALREWLRTAVADMADSPDPATAESGRILADYYLRPAATHVQVASRLHLSRATYFRRLRRGLDALATRHALPD